MIKYLFFLLKVITVLDVRWFVKWFLSSDIQCCVFM